MRPSSWKWSLVPSCCGGTTRNKEQHCVVPNSPVLDFLEWPRSLSEWLREGKCLGRLPSPPSPPLLVFDQSNRINSPLDSPADLVAAAPKLSNKHVRVVPPALCNTTQASSACTDLIRNTMPFIFVFFSVHRGREGGREAGQARGSSSGAAGHFPFSYFSFVFLPLPSSKEMNGTFCIVYFFGLVYFARPSSIHCQIPRTAVSRIIQGSIICDHRLLLRMAVWRKMSWECQGSEVRVAGDRGCIPLPSLVTAACVGGLISQPASL